MGHALGGRGDPFRGGKSSRVRSQPRIREGRTSDGSLRKRVVKEGWYGLIDFKSAKSKKKRKGSRQKKGSPRAGASGSVEEKQPSTQKKI